MQKEDRIKVNKSSISQDPEKDSNLVDFFDLLLTIDKRNNPHLYEIEEKYD